MKKKGTLTAITVAIYIPSASLRFISTWCTVENNNRKMKAMIFLVLAVALSRAEGKRHDQHHISPFLFFFFFF